MAASRFSTFLESFDADPKRRGTQWEHVCKWFLETDPVYRTQLKNVWLWAKRPGRWGPDAGIDLVAQAKAYAPDGKYLPKPNRAPDATSTYVTSPLLGEGDIRHPRLTPAFYSHVRGHPGRWIPESLVGVGETLRWPEDSGKVGAVKMWWQGVAGVVVTTLVMVPALAATCAVACLRPSAGPDPSAVGSAAHAHHGSNPDQREMRVRAELGVTTGHNCRNHDGATDRWGTVPQSAGAGRQVESASSQALQFPQADSGLVARYIRSAHGPPGTAGKVRPLVLRI